MSLRHVARVVFVLRVRLLLEFRARAQDHEADLAHPGEAPPSNAYNAVVRPTDRALRSVLRGEKTGGRRLRFVGDAALWGGRPGV